MIERVVLIGAGRVGYHLGHRVHAAGLPVEQVYSRRLNNARELALALDCVAVQDISKITPLSACIYILAVSDDAIDNIARQLAYLDHPGRFFVHTSGATPVEVLSRHFQHSGVLYPLQTFSRERKVSFQEVPICIHTARPTDLPVLEEFSQQLSDKVYRVDDDQRATLHVAAVFANNFVNHLYTIAHELLEQKGLSFELLRPLIAETSAKVEKHPPAHMQTGPALRDDQRTIMRHLRYLSKSPEYQDIYRLLTRSITKRSADQ